MEYVKCAKAAGLDVDLIGSRLSFFFGMGMSLYMEVAKLRAARTLWAELMKAQGAKKVRFEGGLWHGQGEVRAVFLAIESKIHD